tara:strand:+ start:625 stop:798 length:174 start_codon:yes stop_codon:yes gene_type:complete
LASFLDAKYVGVEEISKLLLKVKVSKLSNKPDKYLNNFPAFSLYFLVKIFRVGETHY